MYLLGFLRAAVTIESIELAAVFLVVLAVTVHVAFIAYLVIGGFLALRWPRTVPLHLAVVAWGIGSDALGWPCPLTSVERWAREHAGMGPLPPEGFIEHYITGVLYPADEVGAVRALVGATVLVSWTLLVANRTRFWSRATELPR